MSARTWFSPCFLLAEEGTLRPWGQKCMCRQGRIFQGDMMWYNLKKFCLFKMKMSPISSGLLLKTRLMWKIICFSNIWSLLVFASSSIYSSFFNLAFSCFLSPITIAIILSDCKSETHIASCNLGEYWLTSTLIWTGEKINTLRKLRMLRNSI